MFGKSFLNNAATHIGNDIYVWDGDATIHPTCPSGYDATNVVQGSSIDTDVNTGSASWTGIGTSSARINGPKYSYSDDCSVCPAG